MPEHASPVVPYGWGPACKPWIAIEQRGLFAFPQETGEVLSAKCPSIHCFGQMVKIVHGRMAHLDSPMDIAPGGQRCSWISIRVLLDPGRYPDLAAQPVPPPVQPPQAVR